MGSTQDEAVQLFNDATLCADPTEKAQSAAFLEVARLSSDRLHATAG